jgi:photosystem II stability/assembly factor-like uncharacterized protein
MWMFVLTLALVVSGCSSDDNPAAPDGSVSGSKWVQISGPGGVNVAGEIRSFLVTASGMFAGTPKGVFRSTDNGNSWFEKNSGRTTGDVNAFAVSGTNLFSGGAGGVYRSTDNGQSWTPVNNGLPVSLVCHDMTASGTSIIANVENLDAGTTRLYRSTDNGDNWTEDPINRGISALAVKGTSFFAGDRDAGVLRSDDDGDTWTRVAAAGGVILDFAVSGEDLYSAVSFNYGGGGVYRSTDNGDNWTEVSTGLPDGEPIEAVEVNGTNLFAGTRERGVHHSTDNGGHWTAVNTGLEGNQQHIRAMAVNGANVFAGTVVDICRSTDNGATWASQPTALATTDVRALAMIGTSLFAATYDRGVCRSDDGGENWIDLTYFNKYQALAVDGDNLYAGGVNGLYRTDDKGESWDKMSVDGDVRALAKMDGRMFVGFEDGRLYALNSGVWTWCDSKMSRILALADAPGSFKYAGGNGSWADNSRKVRYSSDPSGGMYDYRDWYNCDETAAPPSSDCEALVANGEYIYAGFAVMNSRSRVYRGDADEPMHDWTQVAGGDDWELMHTYAMVATGKAVFAAGDKGVYVSTNNGDSWTAVSNGLTTLDVRALLVDGTNLYCGTNGGGIWRREL